MDRDFLPAIELERLTGVAVKTQYNVHYYGKGPLVEILTKCGGRLGAWRADYEIWRDSQRRLQSPQGSDSARAV